MASSLIKDFIIIIISSSSSSGSIFWQTIDFVLSMDL